MYTFIFRYFYKYYSSKKDNVVHFRAVSIVTVVQAAHLFCLLSILKYFDIFFVELHLTGFNKYLAIPLIGIWVYLNWLFFNDKYIVKMKAAPSYLKDEHTTGYFLIILLIFILPFIIGAYFLDVKADEVSQGL